MKQFTRHLCLKYFLICSVLLLGFSFSIQDVNAQQGTPALITGVVTDITGNEPFPGVNITVKGTQIGTITNINGEYSLEVPLESIIIFSYVGFQSIEIKTGPEPSQTFDIHLTVSNEKLEEVVVIGYGSTTKKEVTGSISTVKSDEFNRGSYNDPMGLLLGQVAGLSIINPNGGDPQSGYEIILRGTNTLTSGQGPLVVIDGVAGGDMNNINFQEVESVDILKDGSAAAIYGTRGTNGVIIITTKRAKKGQTTVEYQGLMTVQVAPRMVENLTADEFTDAINNYAPTRVNSIYDGNTNWYDAVTRDVPFSHKHNLAISGGTDQFSHRTVINMEQNQGLLKNNNLDKILARTNIQQKVLDGLLTINYNAFFSQRNYNPANYDIFYQAFVHNPTEPIYDPDNDASGGYNRVVSVEYYNPVAMLNEQQKDGETDDFGGNVRASLQIPFIKGMKWDNFISYEKSRWESRRYRTRYYPSAIGSDGVATIDNGSSKNLQYESTFNLSKTWGNSRIQALAGYTYQDLGSQSSGMSNQGFDTDLYETNNIEAGTALKLGTADMYSYRDMSKLISFFGRFLYNFDEKYLLSASIRREGSSRFGENHKWGWFPAISMGWRINEEEFMTNINWINNLKFRVGYGATGNQEFENYQSLIMMGIAGKFFYDGSWINSYQPTSNPNPDLRWEKKHEVNAGFDFSLFNNRIGGAIDFYYRNSTDLLYKYTVSVPPYLFTEMFTNVGNISNQGIELTLWGVPVKANDFVWNTNATFSKNSNKLISFSNDEFQNGTYKVGWLSGSITSFAQRIEEGKSLGTFYGAVWLGVDEATGKDLFLNQDADGWVPEELWEPIGNAYPDFMMGWSNAFTYKQLDLNFTLRISVGGDILNTYRLYHEDLSKLGLKNILRSKMDNPEQISTAIHSSKYIEDGSFLKLDVISFGYNFKVNTNNFSNIRMYAAAQDVFILTRYKGVNPEMPMSGLEPGIENLSYYPVTTGLTFGVNITFK